MSKEEKEWTETKSRSLAALKKAAAKSSTAQSVRLGSVDPPLLNIPLDHVILDELHLLLRVVDVLLRNVIYMAMRLDREQKTTTNLDDLKAAIRSCGVTFDIWLKKDGRGRNGSDYEWTSLTGKDKKKLLKVCVPHDTCTLSH